MNRLTECPYCGNDEYFIKQRYRGTCEYNMRFDGKPAENGQMWDNAEFANTSKHAYCNNCYKRLFKLEEGDE